MQAASTRIWTMIVDFIFIDDNPYTLQFSFELYISIFAATGRHFEYYSTHSSACSESSVIATLLCETFVLQNDNDDAISPIRLYRFTNLLFVNERMPQRL